MIELNPDYTRRRQQQALDNQKTTLKDVVEATASTVTCNIRTYMTAYDIGSVSDARFPELIRSQGGWRSLVDVVIGTEPLDQDSDEWWIWRMQKDLSDHIKELVQNKLLEAEHVKPE